jgi:hypothetical protein
MTMLKLSTRDQELIQARVQALDPAVERGLTAEQRSILGGVWTLLQESEALLRRIMKGETPKPNPNVPPELGLVLYWGNYFRPVSEFLRKLGMPPTRITEKELDEMWTKILEGPGAVNYDGAFYGSALYSSFDPLWILSLVGYLGILLGIKKKADFGTNPRRARATGEACTIAILGDWGTGNRDGQSPSEQVMSQLAAMSPAPDYTIHLGDVYYAASAKEEKSYLVDCWRAGGECFTLDSNHEMYDGANSYFDVALSPSGPFKGQQRTSYFAIEGDEWVLAGIDSAYGSSSLLFQDGCITDAAQLGFLQKIGALGKKVILTSHHQPMSFDGRRTTDLWGQVVKALGKPPSAWYWGHLHNGIVYSDKSALSGTLGRCVGHGGIPYGNAYALAGQDEIQFYTHTPLPNPGPTQTLLVQNGYAVVRIDRKGNLSETFYNQSGGVDWSSDPAQRAR